MKVTAKNYERQSKKLIELRKQIQSIPNAFRSEPFAIKNKLVIFNRLSNELKAFDARKVK